LKLQYRSALPPFDKTSRLPLLLAALLAAALVIQLVAVDDIALPIAGPIGGVAAARLPDPHLPPASGGGAIVARAMFAPGASRIAGASPPRGVALVGSIRIGRTDFAVVQGPGSRTAYVRAGGRIGDWRLGGLTRTGALLLRGKERLTVPFGGRDIPVASAAMGEHQ